MTYLYCAEMGKDIFVSIVRCDVAKAFGLVPRLDFAFEGGHLGFCSVVLRGLDRCFGFLRLLDLLWD